MAKRPSRGVPEPPTRGNFVSEWFGHRIFPTVATGTQVLDDQEASRCPFLSRATAESRTCIKAPSSLGICTISSASNGPRQDWLVCPYRAVDQHLLDSIVQRLYSLPTNRPVLIVPAPSLLSD